MLDVLAQQSRGREDQITVPLHTMRAMFDKLVDAIVEKCQHTLDRISQAGITCDHMLIVGGFGGSPYLIAKMRAAFQEQVKQGVVSPGVPSQAVLKGVVLQKLAYLTRLV